ncbi:hypothetical protein DXG01_005463 [Tephrocybe rancida]|nr:hypothetical protein DXG01_005463 [Tephrocybe rancida]
MAVARSLSYPSQFWSTSTSRPTKIRRAPGKKASLTSVLVLGLANDSPKPSPPPPPPPAETLSSARRMTYKLPPAPPPTWAPPRHPDDSDHPHPSDRLRLNHCHQYGRASNLTTLSMLRGEGPSRLPVDGLRIPRRKLNCRP